MKSIGVESGSLVEKQPRKHALFEQAMYAFPDEEKEAADVFLSVYKEIYNRFMEGDDDLLPFVHDQVNTLTSKIGAEEIGHYKLFHLLMGSTLDIEDWKKYPLDTTDHDFENLINNVILPELKKRKAA